MSITGVWGKSQQGAGLLETVLAVAILGTAAVAMGAGLSTGLLAIREAQEQATVEQIARSQAEYLKTLPYLVPPASYATVASPASDFTLTASAAQAEGDDRLSLVTITVYRNGQPVATVETYKTDR